MDTLIIGHRGAMGKAPENTAISFQSALDAGADGVEFDVHMSSDDHLMVIHDERVDRTTNGKGFIKNMTIKEIKGLDAGLYYNNQYSGEKILTLEETLEIVQGMSVINIELKNGPIFYPGIEKRVLSVVKEFQLGDKVIISSFNHYSIARVRELNREIKCGLLYKAGLFQPWEYAKMVQASAIHPFYASILPEIVEGCHQQGISVNVYGANQEEQLLELLKMRVDMIITDYPELALKLKNNM